MPTGEVAELIFSGTPNIVCIQPFACLPNHMVGNGVIKLMLLAAGENPGRKAVST